MKRATRSPAISFPGSINFLQLAVAGRDLAPPSLDLRFFSPRRFRACTRTIRGEVPRVGAFITRYEKRSPFADLFLYFFSISFFRIVCKLTSFPHCRFPWSSAVYIYDRSRICQIILVSLRVVSVIGERRYTDTYGDGFYIHRGRFRAIYN